MLDISWYGSDFTKDAANDLNVPYVRVDVSISPFLKLFVFGTEVCGLQKFF